MRKREAFCSWESDISCKAKRLAHSRAKAAVQSQVRELKNSRWTDKAMEIQRLAVSGNTRGFFSATKVIYGPSYRGLNPVPLRNGKELLEDNEPINARWKEHFRELLKCNSTTVHDIINHNTWGNHPP